MYLKINLLLTISWLFASFSFGQDAQVELQAEMERIQQKMDTVNTVSIRVEANVYSKRGGSKVSSVSASRYQRGDEYFTDLAGLSVLETKNFAMRLDHEERSILVLKKEKPKKKLKTETIDLDISALNKMMETESESKMKVSMVSANGNLKKYRVTGMSGIISMEITLNVDTSTIVAVNFEYGTVSSPGQFIELSYEMSYNQNVDEQLNTTNYFTEENGEFVVSSNLSNYNLYTEL